MSIIRVTKLRMRWTVQVAHMGDRVDPHIFRWRNLWEGGHLEEAGAEWNIIIK